MCLDQEGHPVFLWFRLGWLLVRPAIRSGRHEWAAPVISRLEIIIFELIDP